jgi:hypothetical protein
VLAHLPGDSSADDCDESVQRVFQMLEIKYVQRQTAEDGSLAAAAAASSAATDAQVNLQALQKKTLQDICRDRGLPSSGNKAELIERIKDNNLEPSRRTMASALLSRWFMPPFRNQHTKLGTMNEDSALRKFPAFIHKHGRNNMRVREWKDYGLLVNFHQEEAAFSPDGIVVIDCADEEEGAYVAGVEVKSRTTDNTQESEHKLAGKFGKYAEFSFSVRADNQKTLKHVIPEAAYRSQLLHSLCSAGLDSWFYVSASLSNIIRVVKVSISPGDRFEYMSALTLLRLRHINWVYDETVPLPTFTEEEIGYAKSKHAVEETLHVWRALNSTIESTGQPLPPGRHLLPSLIAMWNRIKGGVDVFSRVLENCKAVHGGSNPTATIWRRLIMALVYNAHQTRALVKVRLL